MSSAKIVIRQSGYVVDEIVEFDFDRAKAPLTRKTKFSECHCDMSLREVVRKGTKEVNKHKSEERSVYDVKSVMEAGEYALSVAGSDGNMY